ncbi:MAG: cytochrome c [Phycisphaeraceae bacterium]
MRIFLFSCMVLLMICGCGSSSDDSTGEARSSPVDGISTDPPGRRIYLTQCTRCHAALRIADHSPEQWRKILPDMIRRSRLTDRQADDVTAYIFHELSAPTSP